jgi:hypothetical protein
MTGPAGENRNSLRRKPARAGARASLEVRESWQIEAQSASTGKGNAPPITPPDGTRMSIASIRAGVRQRATAARICGTTYIFFLRRRPRVAILIR